MSHLSVLFFCTVVVATLSACGGRSNGGSSASTASASPVSDPGEVAYVTLLGVDTNANGIRDEVEFQLNAQYSNDTTSLASALMSAKAYQRILAADDTQVASTEAMRASAESAVCIMKALGNDGRKANEITTRTFLLTYNTQDRLAKRKEVSRAAGSFKMTPVSEVKC